MAIFILVILQALSYSFSSRWVAEVIMNTKPPCTQASNAIFGWDTYFSLALFPSSFGSFFPHNLWASDVRGLFLIFRPSLGVVGGRMRQSWQLRNQVWGVLRSSSAAVRGRSRLSHTQNWLIDPAQWGIRGNGNLVVRK